MRARRSLAAALSLAVSFAARGLAAPPEAAAPDAAQGAARVTIQHETLTLPLARGAAQVHHFAIPLAHVVLSYVDLKYETPLVEALGNHDLVLNGGYWGYREQRRVIEGLLIVNGEQLASAHPRGGVLELRGGKARVVRGEQYAPAPETVLALQCSPRLVDGGKVIPKLEARKRAPRTALCVGADHGVLSAYLTESAITLLEFAEFLRAQGCVEALNLDGGPSTAAVARLPMGVITVGRGLSLPYGIGFRLSGSSGKN
jgi:hypothetical protein